MTQSNEEIKPGSKLRNVTDIFGVTHEQMLVLNIYEHTVTAVDEVTKNCRVIHKKTLHLKEGHNRKDTTWQPFNLAKCQKLKYTDKEVEQHGARALGGQYFGNKKQQN